MEEKGAPSDDTICICPLYAFKCNIEGSKHIDLGKGIAIWPISDDLQCRINERIPELELDANEVEWGIQLPHNPRGRASTETEIATHRDRISHEFSLLEDSSEIASDLITALRLRHEGDVAPGPLLQLVINNAKFTQGNLISWFPLSKSGDYFVSVRTPYELQETEVDTLREFWQDFQDKRQKGKLSVLNIALRRFNSSYGESLEDRLLDQMIALESLYLGDLQELSYKLALRAAFLLARGRKGRTQVLKRLKKAYDARSKVVHGQKPPDNLMELVKYTEEYLRQSINRFITLSEQYKLNDLRERLLDQNIIEAGQLLKAK